MAAAIFRFYQELNDFLAPELRQRDLSVGFEGTPPLRHLIELQGVPHTEVEIVLCNGASVPLEHQLADGDRISVYPMFERLDVTPLLRLRAYPLRDSRFLADAHLGRLAGYLRMLGFDTLCGHRESDRQLVASSVAERRILLSRDRALLMHRSLTHGCYVHARLPLEQLREVVQRLDLCRQLRPFTRCIRCNGRLDPVAASAVAEKVPPKVRASRERFWSCPGCHRVYWRGTHYQHMHQLVQGLCPPLDRFTGQLVSRG